MTLALRREVAAAAARTVVFVAVVGAVTGIVVLTAAPPVAAVVPEPGPRWVRVSRSELEPGRWVDVLKDAAPDPPVCVAVLSWSLGAGDAVKVGQLGGGSVQLVTSAAGTVPCAEEHALQEAPK